MTNGSHWHGTHWNWHWHDGHWYSAPSAVGADQVSADLAIHPAKDVDQAMDETQEFTLEIHDLAKSMEIHPTDSSMMTVGGLVRESTDTLKVHTEETFAVER